jgi:hypothetical protein
MNKEVERQLETLGSTWMATNEKAQKMQIESEIQNLKHSEGFGLALFNLISNPQLDETVAFFMISTLKSEAKLLFSNKKKSIYGNILLGIVVMSRSEFIFPGYHPNRPIHSWIEQKKTNVSGRSSQHSLQIRGLHQRRDQVEHKTRFHSTSP